MGLRLISNAREQFRLPGSEREIRRGGNVKIVHPGLNLTLLELPALDLDPSGSPHYGVFYFLALDGCRVLTNGLAGYFATDAQKKTPVFCGNNFLAAGRYLSFVDNHDVPKSDYGVATEFEAWVFRDMPIH